MDILFTIRNEDLPAMSNSLKGGDVEVWFRQNFDALVSQLLEIDRRITVDAKLAAAGLTTLQPADVDLLVAAKAEVAAGTLVLDGGKLGTKP